MSSRRGADGPQSRSHARASQVSRRRLLATLGVASAVSVAGCNSGDPGDSTPSDGGTVTSTDDTDAAGSDTESDGETETEGEPDVFVLQAGNPAVDTDLSMLGSLKQTQRYGGPMITPIGLNRYEQVFDGVDYVPMLFESVGMNDDNSVWTAKLAEGFEWWDGTPVTMRDWYYELQYLREFEKTGVGDPAFDYDEIELVDDRTIRFHLLERQPLAMFLANHKDRIWYPRTHTKPWFEKMRDATTGQEALDVNRELSRTKVRLSDDEMEQFGHGLWKPTRITDQYVEYDRVPDHPLAEHNGVDKLRLVLHGSDAARRLKWLDELYDQGYVTGPLLNVDFPERYERHAVDTFENYRFEFNFNHEDLGKRTVRQAIAYWLQTENFVGNTENLPGGPQVGMVPSAAEAFVEDWDEVKDEYIQYGTQRKADQAETLMRDLGYYKFNNTWLRPNGDEAELKLLINSWWSDPCQNFASQLRQFGFTVTTEVVAASDYFPIKDLVDPAPDRWGMTMVRSNRSGVNHPAPYYANHPNGMWMHAENDDGERFGRMGRPLEPELPPLGEREGSGGPTLDIVDMQDRLDSPDATRQELSDLVADFTHYYNWDLPYLDGYYESEEFVIDEREWVWPDWDGDGVPNGISQDLPKVLHWDLQPK